MIFITSHAYFSPRHIKVFQYFKKKDDLVFILPEKWREKNGKIVEFNKEGLDDLNIILTKAYFYHSRYPLVKGLLKGWMPATKGILKKMAHKGDILYTATEPNLLLTYFNAKIAKKMGLKHVFFTWQNIPYTKRLFGAKLRTTEWLINKNVFLSRAAVAGTKKALDILDEYLPKGFISGIVPISGADTERFRPGIHSNFREKYNLNGKIVVTFAGMFEIRKGVPAILEGFKEAVSKIKELHLVMIGTGILKANMQKFIQDNHLSEAITIIDWIPNAELPGIYANSDIYLYPSQPNLGWEEQFGYSLVEGSSSQLPVISTKSGSIDEIILDGQTGILIKPGSSSELAGALLKLGGNAELRTSMGKAGRDYVLKEYSHEAVAGKLENFLRGL